jgi:hypothetical protein
MKNFLFSLLLFAVISEISVSQTYEELQDIFYFTSKKLDAARDSIGILELKTNVQDSIINNQKRIISNDSLINTNNEQIINTLKEQLYKGNEETGFIQFKGFYAGLTASYSFNDPAITKQTIIEGTVYDLTGTFRFDVMDKGSLSGSVGIPLRNEKFYVKVCAEWKVF